MDRLCSCILCMRLHTDPFNLQSQPGHRSWLRVLLPLWPETVDTLVPPEACKNQTCVCVCVFLREDVHSANFPNDSHENACVRCKVKQGCNPFNSAGLKRFANGSTKKSLLPARYSRHFKKPHSNICSCLHHISLLNFTT